MKKNFGIRARNLRSLAQLFPNFQNAGRVESLLWNRKFRTVVFDKIESRDRSINLATELIEIVVRDLAIVT